MLLFLFCCVWWSSVSNHLKGFQGYIFITYFPAPNTHTHHSPPKFLGPTGCKMRVRGAPLAYCLRYEKFLEIGSFSSIFELENPKNLNNYLCLGWKDEARQKTFEADFFCF